MKAEPGAPHSSSPAELQEQLAAERRGKPFLLLRSDDGVQQIVALEGDRLSVGRRASNDVPLPWDTEVSRLHAELHRIGGEWVAIDDGLSANGSFVNGDRLSGRRRLRDGDVLRFGRTSVLYRAPGEQSTVRTAAGAAVPTVESLTDSQRRVLVALCRPLVHGDDRFGLPATNQQIAEEVHLSVDSVKTHLRTLFGRFGMSDLPQNEKRARLVEAALQWGLVSPRDL
jgi:pSer/pThr/pTyr-binding forkhead associated (FHA) protein